MISDSWSPVMSLKSDIIYIAISATAVRQRVSLTNIDLTIRLFFDDAQWMRLLLLLLSPMRTMYQLFEDKSSLNPIDPSLKNIILCVSRLCVTKRTHTSSVGLRCVTEFWHAFQCILLFFTWLRILNLASMPGHELATQDTLCLNFLKSVNGASMLRYSYLCTYKYWCLKSVSTVGCSIVSPANLSGGYCRGFESNFAPITFYISWWYVKSDGSKIRFETTTMPSPQRLVT